MVTKMMRLSLGCGVALIFALGALVQAIDPCDSEGDNGAWHNICADNDHRWAQGGATSPSNLENQVSAETSYWIDGGTGANVGTFSAYKSETASWDKFCDVIEGYSDHYAILSNESWVTIKSNWSVGVDVGSCSI